MIKAGLALRPWAVLAAGVLVLGLSAAQATPSPPAAVATAPSLEREILVMLRLPPDHHRPNAAYGGDYGDQITLTLRRRLAQKIAHRYGLEFVGDGWPMPLLGIDCYVMRVGSGEAIETAMKRISGDPEIAWSEPMHVYQTQGTTSGTDPLFALQPTATAWRLADLHRVTTGRGVVVAVVDSRVEANHPDLQGQVVTSQDFVVDRPGPPESHGTGVAGVIAAKAGNGVGIVGVAPGARLMALRACWQIDKGAPNSPTVCDSLSLAKALHYAIENRATVINLSLSGPQDRLLGQLIDLAAQRRITVVAAYDAQLPKGGFPASAPTVIAVANESLPSAPPGVYLAPGEDVPTTQPGGRWILVNGSSYAAAHVSGLVALVREYRAAPPNPLLEATLPAGGFIDACATLLHASKPCDCTCPAPTTLAKAPR